MSTSTLSGLTVTRARVQLPAWGMWFADVEVDSTDTLSGSVDLVIADATFVGTILTGGAVSGRGRWRIVGGAGGWGSEIAEKHYANDAGVNRSLVLGDAASDAGETIEDVPAGVVGTSWTRRAGPASDTLEQLYPSGWYVGVDGVTRIGAWPSTTYTGGAPAVEPFDPARGRVVLAADEIATLVPGVTVYDAVSVDVEHRIDAGKLRTVVWTERSGSSRALGAMRAIVDAFSAEYRYRGAWEYRVVSQTGERLNLQVVRRSTGMPDLRRVRVRPGVPGVSADHKLGGLVLVTFVDGDPARPAVVGFDDAESPGYRPDELLIESGATGASPTEHATSAEALVLMQAAMLTAIGATISGALTGSALALAQVAIVNAAIAAMSGTIAPYSVALAAALAAKTANVTGLLPSVGWPDVRGG